MLLPIILFFLFHFINLISSPIFIKAAAQVSKENMDLKKKLEINPHEEEIAGLRETLEKLENDDLGAEQTIRASEAEIRKLRQAFRDLCDKYGEKFSKEHLKMNRNALEVQIKEEELEGDDDVAETGSTKTKKDNDKKNDEYDPKNVFFLIYNEYY
jgi:chromosome segregation ATPase